jgi:hypothetical protein
MLLPTPVLEFVLMEPLVLITSVPELLLEEVVVLPVAVTPTPPVPLLVPLVMEPVPPVMVEVLMTVLPVTDGGITELPISLVNCLVLLLLLLVDLPLTV